MNVIVKCTLWLAMAITPMSGRAQLLEIMASDTTGLGTGMVIIPGGDYRPLVFAAGKMIIDELDVKPMTPVSVMVPSGLFTAVVEPGETLQMRLAKKEGQWMVRYKGKNKRASEFQNELVRLNASGWEDISLDEFDEEVVTLKKSFDFAAEAARVDRQYRRCKDMAESIQPVALASEYLRRVEAQYLVSRLSMARGQEEMAGRDPQKSEVVRAILSEVNPNDMVMHELGLTVPFIQSKLTTTSRDSDQTAYGIEFAKTVVQTVTNEQVRHDLFGELASSMFNADYDGRSFDLDRFWEVYRSLADQANVEYYQTIVSSRQSTASGTPCPDETFVDPQGNSHRLSEFFNQGKYIYIDIWATWCIPCCAEIPFVERHVEHYKDNPKVQFISISIDHDHGAWHRKLQKDKPQWQQFLSATKADTDKLMKDWGITGIPRFVIINPDGTINQASAFRPSDEKFYERMDAIMR